MSRKVHLVQMTEETLSRYKEQLHLELAAVLAELTLREELRQLENYPIGDGNVTELDRLF
jgi:hypothetical protein